MKKFLVFLYAMVLVFSVFGSANAVLINAVSASGTGTYHHSADLLIDGTIPAEKTGWTNSTNVWWHGTTPTFTIDLGSLCTVEDVLLQVDNNDYYNVEYSTNGSSWNNLFSINSGFGEVGWGMDTMSTDSSNPEYIDEINFTPVSAQYLRIYATGGDNSYAVSELQAYGTTAAPVPEPCTLLLMGSGILGMAGFGGRKRLNKMS